ncbi:unnamed protein product [Dimorphilus gyrociliatus]|uniref:Uncharacterized protein n=1 Tax=Dimorphilus gyrociliatus TaxID=2664684 RepID=A0A7I8WB88_9ANNE|nr:unnamed protein product [Dimorphilus gyrociliatus]
MASQLKHKSMGKPLSLQPVNQKWYESVVDDFTSSISSNLDQFDIEAFLEDIRCKGHVSASTPNHSASHEESPLKVRIAKSSVRNSSQRRTQHLDSNPSSWISQVKTVRRGKVPWYIRHLKIPFQEFRFEPVHHVKLVRANCAFLKKTFRDYAIRRAEEWSEAALIMSDLINPTASKRQDIS